MVKRGKTASSKGPSRKLLLAILLLTCIASLFLLSYFFFALPRSDGSRRAAIVDQLSIEPGLVNTEFIDDCTSSLTTSGFEVQYYSGEEITVEFFEGLPSTSGEVVIIRAHSAIRGDTKEVDIFTSENYSDQLVYGKYLTYVDKGYLSDATFGSTRVFAIGPGFARNAMRDRFSDSLIFLMGCESLNQTTMAEALIEKGVRVVIGWTRLVTADYTDHFTKKLLNELLSENPETVRGAITKINTEVSQDDQNSFNTRLAYYPNSSEAGNFKIDTSNRSTSRLTIQTFEVLCNPKMYIRRRETTIDYSL